MVPHPRPANPPKPGVLYEYVSDAQKIAECPTNKRRGRSGETSQTSGGQVWQTALDFDYTMLSRMHGARLGLDLKMGRLKTPAAGTPPTFVKGSLVHVWNGLVLYAEESVALYNHMYPDGRWGNDDQMTQRHFGAGNVAFLEGHVLAMKNPMGPIKEVKEPNDFDCNDVYILGRGDQWKRIEMVPESYGAINAGR